MRGQIQNIINPPQNITRELEFSSEKIKNTQSQNTGNKINFDEIIVNSNYEAKKEREAKTAGGIFTGKENEKEFLEKLSTISNQQQARAPKNTLDKNDFLKLFVTQLQHQDPLNPDDGTEMASKLAQFNSLEQMLNVNKTLEKLLEAQKINRTAELINYVGKEVYINSGRFYFNGDKNTELKFELKSPSTNAILQIRDNNGVIVMEKELGTMKEGENKVSWDGKNKNGELLPKGLYHFSIFAKDMNNQPIEVSTKTKVKITGIDIQNKDESFYTNLGKIKLSDITALGIENFDKLEQLNNNISTNEKNTTNNLNSSNNINSENLSKITEQTSQNLQTSNIPNNETQTPREKENNTTISENSKSNNKELSANLQQINNSTQNQNSKTENSLNTKARQEPKLAKLNYKKSENNIFEDPASQFIP